MTFLDLTEGGGEEMGKECSGGAGLDEGSFETRVAWACAVSRRANLGAGEIFFAASAGRSGRSVRADAFMPERSGVSSAEARRVAGGVVLGANFEGDSSALATSSFDSDASATVACVSESATGSVLTGALLSSVCDAGLGVSAG
jgi:hypothetical protein